jgi:hypothetical protein
MMLKFRTKALAVVVRGAMCCVELTGHSQGIFDLTHHISGYWQEGEKATKHRHRLVQFAICGSAKFLVPAEGWPWLVMVPGDNANVRKKDREYAVKHVSLLYYSQPLVD